MSDRARIDIPMDEKTLAHFWRLIGAADMHAYLEEVPADKRPIGFSFALAVVAKELAELRIRHTSNILRCVAAAGHDVSKYPDVMSGLEDSGPVLWIPERDLMDMAETSP